MSARKLGFRWTWKHSHHIDLKVCSVKRCRKRLSLKEVKFSAFRILSGKEFHSKAGDIENKLLNIEVLIGGM